MGSMFGFGGQTWVRVSSKFDLSSSKFVIFGFDQTQNTNPNPSLFIIKGGGCAQLKKCSRSNSLRIIVSCLTTH